MCPLEFQVPTLMAPGEYVLVGDDGKSIPLQAETSGLARCVLPELLAGETRSFVITKAGSEFAAPAVSVIDDAGAVSIGLPDGLLTRYIYADVVARPYFFPLHAPGGIPVTRAYPMRDDVPVK